METTSLRRYSAWGSKSVLPDGLSSARMELALSAAAKLISMICDKELLILPRRRLLMSRGGWRSSTIDTAMISEESGAAKRQDLLSLLPNFISVDQNGKVRPEQQSLPSDQSLQRTPRKNEVESNSAAKTVAVKGFIIHKTV